MNSVGISGKRVDEVGRIGKKWEDCIMMWGEELRL